MERTRVHYIDGLRACAVLGVIACHAALLMPAWASITTVSAGVPWYWLGHALVDGAHGVDLFFVLSGFCLAYPTLARIQRDGSSAFDLARFATHRLVRILPPYVLSIAVFSVFAAAAYLHSGGFTFPEAGHVSAADYFRQFLFLDRGTTMVNSNFWTLAVEFRWYFIFPLCLAAWVWAPRLLGVLIVGAVVLYSQTRLYTIDLGVLPAFLLGIVAADWHLRRHSIVRYALPLAGMALVVGVLTEPWATMPGPDGLVFRSFFLQSNFGWQLAAFFFVLAAGRDGLLKRLLSIPALVSAGVASYSIYLMHAPLMFIAASRLSHVSPPVAFGALAVVGIASGYLFWWVAERRFTEDPGRAAWHGRVAPLVCRIFDGLAVPSVVQLAPARAGAPAVPRDVVPRVVPRADVREPERV